jgi:hypothetical protein
LWVWPKRISLEREEELTEVVARLMPEKANYPCTSQKLGLDCPSNHEIIFSGVQDFEKHVTFVELSQGRRRSLGDE